MSAQWETSRTPPGEAPDERRAAQTPTGFWIDGLVGWRPYLTIGALGRLFLAVICFSLVSWILWRGRSTLLPFVFGGFVALILTPVVQLFERWMSRRTAILVIYTVAAFGLGAGFAFGGPWLAAQIQYLIDAIPSVIQLQGWINSTLARWEAYLPASWVEPVNRAAQSAISELQANVVLYVQHLGTFVLNHTMDLVYVFSLFTAFLVLPFWIYFVLDSSPEIRERLDKALHPAFRADFWAIWSLFTRVVGAYVRGTLMLGAIVGVMVVLGMSLLRWMGFEVPNIFLLAVFSGLGEFIPFIGPIVSSAPAIGVMLSGSFTTGLAMLVVYIVVQQLESNFLVPYVMGEAIRVHPAIMTVALFAAGGAFGFIGVLLAPPLTAFGRDFFVYTYSRLQGHTAERAYAIARPPKAQAAATA